MGAHVLRRLLLAVPLLVVVSFLVFALVASFPGDPCRERLGQHVSEEALARCRAELGLDRPFLARYGRFLADAVRLDFGRDFRTGEPVGRTIVETLPAPKVSPFPAVFQDISVIVGDETAAATVVAAVRDGAGELLEDVKLFDVYTGPQIGEGRKSLTLALRFRAADRTLTEDEASAARDAAVAAAAERVGAVLRG